MALNLIVLFRQVPYHESPYVSGNLVRIQITCGKNLLTGSCKNYRECMVEFVFENIVVRRKA